MAKSRKGVSQPRRVEDGELFAALRRLARQLNHLPTCREFEQLSGHSDDLARQRFGSWPDFVRASGLNYSYRHPSPRPESDEQVISDLKRVANDLGKPPTVAEYKEKGKWKVDTLYRRAPEHTWVSVLVAFLGLPLEEAKAYSTRGGVVWRTTEERLKEFRELVDRLGRTPSRDEANGLGINTGVLVSRHGSWLKACEAAGVAKPRSLSRPGQHLTEAELLREVTRVAGLVGKFPSPKAFDDLSEINHKTVAKHVGSGKWSAVERRWLSLQVSSRTGPARSTELKPVPDKVRDTLKMADIPAIKEFFRSKKP